ncbi:hypothetical protein QR680_010159 [Steinernema hermaphroditum]|uniref:Uncharacterized protein n=1 Tax=Steinernema hermaphroditum TaxID=289476 RepID=A0AA39IQL2_9BILA|nr:hypothetical protein QR680_010159 [Steinernema hermaphroditum]
MTSESVIAGMIYAFECFLIIPLHILIVVILLRGKEFRNRIAYRIMTHMSACECLQMVGYLLGAIMSLFQSTVHVYLGRIGGCLINAGWTGIVLFTFLLTLNRLIVFSELRLTAVSEKRFFNTMLLTTWTLTALDFAIHVAPEYAMIYVIEKSTYWFAEGNITVLGTFESWFIIVVLIITFITCIACVIMIIVKRNLYSSQFKISSGEIKLFFQCFVIFLYLSIIRAIWQFGQDLLTNYTSLVALGAATQAVGGLNPVLYLILNKSIRLHLWKLLGCRKIHTVKVKNYSMRVNSSLVVSVS